MKIAFLTSVDPTDRRSWSGTYYHMFRALEKHCGTVTPLGPVALNSAGALRIGAGLVRRMTGKRYVHTHNPILSRQFGRVFTEKLKQDNYDLIYAPAASVEVASVETEVPIVYFSDTTFSNMIDYYESFSNLLSISKKHGCWLESQGIKKASLLLYPSEWAAQSAIRDFGAPPERTHVVSFGANFEEIPPREVVIGKQQSEICRLLFLGVDWKRKGGDIAYSAFQSLKKMGIRSQLTICGCTPPFAVSDRDISVTGFLNKNEPEGRKKFAELLLNSDFLLMPTRAECTAIAFCEASAFGLPSISTDTGGVAGAVTDGVNGRLLSMSAGGYEYAQAIAAIWTNHGLWRSFVQNSRAEYERRLNWDAWGVNVSALVQRLFPSLAVSTHQ